MDTLVEKASLQSYPSYTPEDKSKCVGIPARYVLAIMSFLGFFNVYAMRVNLSVALIAMVNSTDTGVHQSHSHECPGHTENNTNASSLTGEFNWDEKTQGHVLGSFFYGYMLTNLLGGWLTCKYGGKNLFGLGILCTAVLTLLTPVAARTSVYLLIVVRVLEGIGEGVTYPAVHAMWGLWAPKLERSKLSAFSYGGSMLGNVITLPVAGYLCDTNFLGGWPSAFYVFGALGCVWFIAWQVLVYSTPAQHPRISQEERNYIESSIGNTEVIPTPWRSILTSPQVISVCIAQYCGQWGFFMLLTSLPIYLKTIQKFDIKSNGLVSALPYLPTWIMITVVGVFADFLRSRGFLSTLNTRRIFNTIGTLVPAALLLLCGYAGCDRILVVALLTLSCTFHSCMFSGAIPNGLDIAPRFSGVIMGLSNGLSTTAGFMAPLLVGYLTNNNQTTEQWRKIFYINAAFSVFGSVLFVVLAAGHELPWARIHVKDDAIDNGAAICDHKTTTEDKLYLEDRLLLDKETDTDL